MYRKALRALHLEERKEQGGKPCLAEAHKIEACRPKNWLVPVILLALRERNSYGYKLMERTAELGFEAMNPGTLYRTLRQVEKEGLCESRWETSKWGPARRMYSILHYGRRRGVSRPISQVAGAVSTQHGRLLPALRRGQLNIGRPAEKRRVAERGTPAVLEVYL